MTDTTAVALAEEHTAETEAAGETAVEIEAIREDASTERTEIREGAETERTEIIADAMVAVAEAEGDNGVDEEWLRSQFDAQSQRQSSLETAMLGLTGAISNLTALLSDQATLTPLAPLEAETPLILEPEPTAALAPEPVANHRGRKTVLF